MSDPDLNQHIDAQIDADLIDSSNISLGNPQSLTQITDHSTHHHYYAPHPTDQPASPAGWRRLIPSRHTSVAPWTAVDRTTLIRVLRLLLHNVDDPTQQRVYLELGLHLVPRLVAPVWRRHLGQSLTKRPVVEPLATIFERSRGLLLVGAPGTGKSTFLRELCAMLLEQAEQNGASPVPVMVNLAGFEPTIPFVKWISQQLDQIFSGQTPAFWEQSVRDQRLTVLFDGLDEVQHGYRPACIAALNDFGAIHRTAVTSRTAEYASIGNKLTFDTAIEIQPLTPNEVLETLQAMGRATAGLRAAIRQSPALQETLTTPLMLHVAATTYAGTTATTIRATTPETLHQELWRAYLQRMLARHTNAAWSTKQILDWLRWIARMLKTENVTTLYVEALQPRMAQRAFKMRVWWAVVGGVLCGVAAAVFGAIVGVISGGATGGLIDGRTWYEEMVSGFNLGILGGLIFGIGVGVWMGLAGGLQRRISSFKDRTWSWVEWRRSIGSVLAEYLRHGIIGGLSIGLCAGFVTRIDLGIGVGLLSGLGIGSLIAIIDAGWTYTLNQDTTKPNQNTWGLARSGIKQGLSFGIMFGVIFGIIGGLMYTPAFGIATWFIGGLLGGFMFAVANGLGDFFKHFILRFILWQEGSLPLQLVAFLDHGCALLLLRRFGGAYQFYHLTLRDFLADCSDADLVALRAEVETVRG